MATKETSDPAGSEGRPRSLSKRLALPAQIDDVQILTVYIVLLFTFPASMVITALGEVGGPAVLLALGCFLWWAWSSILRRQTTAGRGFVKPAMLVMLLITLVTYAHSNLIPLPFAERSPSDAGLLRMVAGIGVALLIVDGVPSMQRLWTLVERISLVYGVMAVLALIQAGTRQVWVDRIKIPGLAPPADIELIARGVITRPSGTATHPIEFAAVMAVGLPLVLAAAGHKGRRQRWHGAIAILVATVLMMTGSRTAIVCGAVAFVAMLPAWRLVVRLFACAVAMGIVAALFVAAPGLVGTVRGLFVGTSNDSSVLSRTDSYSIAAEFWERHIFLGRGLGTFIPQYWIFDNQYLGMLIGAGLLGVAGLLWLIIAALVDSSKAAIPGAAATTDRQLAVAIRAGVLSGAVSLALFDVFGFAQAAGMFFLLLGLSGAVRRVVQAADPPSPDVPPTLSLQQDGAEVVGAGRDSRHVAAD